MARALGATAASQHEPAQLEVARVSAPSGSAQGALLQENHVLVTWHRFLHSIGLEGQPGQRPLRMHDLRHTRGTLMADEGEDTTTIQKTLGHARQSITADLYVGRISKALRASADRFGDLLDPSSRQNASE